MNLPEQFDEAMTLARASVRLKIRKHADDHEDFDPEALLYSLFEAEVPFKHIFHIFDRILERLRELNDLNEVTERQLHGLVTTSISAYPNPDTSVWVSNYHDVYAVDAGPEQDDGGEDIDLSDHEKLVPARKASLIRHLIKLHLARELGVTISEVTDLIDVEDLREATNRLLKFIRFAGLTEVPLATLSSLVEELSAHSQKKFIHRKLDEKDLKKDIGLAERSFEAARKLSDSDPFQAQTELRLALELLGRIFLAACRLPSRPARQHSFQYMHGLLRTLDHQARGQKTQELPGLVIERVDSAMALIAKDKKYQITSLRESADALAKMSETFTSSTFEEGASAFRSILYSARALHGFSVGRRRIVDALRASSDQRSRQVSSAAAEFIVEELHLRHDDIESSAGAALRVRDLAWLKVHADCLRHGRDLLLLFRFGHSQTALSLAQVQDFLYLVLADSSSLGIIFSDQTPDHGLLEELKRLSLLPGRRIVTIWMDANALTRMFLRPDAFLSTIDSYLKRAMPWLDASADQSRPEDHDMIPAGITGYIREYLAVLNRLEAERAWPAIRAEITPLLEELASDYKHYLSQRVLHAIPKGDRSIVEPQLQPFIVGSSLGSARQFTQRCLSLLPTGVISAALESRLKSFSGFVERVRSHRNRLVHEHGAASEVARALHEMIEGLRELVQAVPYPSLYLCLRDSETRLKLAPLFGAAERPQTPEGARAGGVLAVWNVGTAQELILPKKLKPNRDDTAAVPLMIDLSCGDLAGEAKGQGRLSPVLSRALKTILSKADETHKAEGRPRSGDMGLIASWLVRITANPIANSMPAELVATLGGYDYELATEALVEALQHASNLLGVQIEVTSNGHGLVMKDDSGERIGCSIFDQTGLRDHARIRSEIDRWVQLGAKGVSHHFAFLFADPTQCEEEIRRFKRDVLTSGSGTELYALDRILEPKHTYFLLQRTGVERQSLSIEPFGGQGGGAAPQSPAKRESAALYDVFISYNSEDRDAVREIVNQLKESGVVPWFDIEALRPGTPWPRELAGQIERTSSAAVFFGKSGMGPWQQEEMEAILRRFISLGRPVIPVILPNGRIDPGDLLFLENRTRVDFRSSSPPPLKQLIWGITGTRLG